MVRVQRVQQQQLLAEGREGITVQAAAVRLQLAQKVPERPQALPLGRRLLRDGAGLGHVRHHHHHGVRVGDPHVAHVPVGLEQRRVVLPHVAHAGRIQLLVQSVTRNALEGDLGDHAEGAHRDPRQAEEVGVGPVGAELQLPPARGDQLHARDHLVDGGDARAGAVRGHLRPAADLLLGDGAEVRERHPVLLQLLQDARHAGPALDRDGHALGVDVEDTVKLGQREHTTLLQGEAVRRQSRADGADLLPHPVRPGDHSPQLLLALGGVEAARRELVRAAPVHHGHIGLARYR
mmetsp:Transcript_117951/g.334470  ORF Transcript_117951/g.334470 Transcript_117951/m.334470 type:complete len:292 (+) Transcript_117951:791-1666(+)